MSEHTGEPKWQKNPLAIWRDRAVKFNENTLFMSRAGAHDDFTIAPGGGEGAPREVQFGYGAAITALMPRGEALYVLTTQGAVKIAVATDGTMVALVIDPKDVPA